MMSARHATCVNFCQGFFLVSLNFLLLSLLKFPDQWVLFIYISTAHFAGHNIIALIALVFPKTEHLLILLNIGGFFSTFYNRVTI